jgi:hypothetical protein
MGAPKHRWHRWSHPGLLGIVRLWSNWNESFSILAKGYWRPQNIDDTDEPKLTWVQYKYCLSQSHQTNPCSVKITMGKFNASPCQAPMIISPIPLCHPVIKTVVSRNLGSPYYLCSQINEIGHISSTSNRMMISSVLVWWVRTPVEHPQ